MELVRIKKQLYKDINKEQDLVEFFSLLTECFKEEVKEEVKQRNIELDISEPDFENLIIMAKNLKDLGIETSLLSNDIVASQTILHNASPDELKKIILDYDEIAFNDFAFSDDIKRKLRQYTSFHPAAYIRGIRNEHEELRNSKEELTKKLEREHKKFINKKRIFGSLISKNQQLIELEQKERELNYIYHKNDFYIKRTNDEKKEKIIIMFDSILDMREQYSIYLNSQKKKEEILKEMKLLLFIRALGRLMQRESQKIDLEKIQIKLLKVLYLNYFCPQYLSNIFFLAFDTDKLNFNVELVDWFVSAYEAELLKLSDAAIENFDLLIENKSSKILSKKITEG